MIGPLILVMSIAGMLPVYLISKLLNWGIFARFMEMQELAIVVSVFFAVIITIAIYGFAHGDGGSWEPGWGKLTYSISGLIVVALRLRWYSHYQDNPPADPHLPELQDTFE